MASRIQCFSRRHLLIILIVIDCELFELTANIKDFRSELFTAKGEIETRGAQITEKTNGPSGIYSMKIRGMNTFKAPCNSTGWLTIQKRFDGSENFDRTWKGAFFIGLERLHVMTKERPHELYIKLGKVDGSTGYAHYNDFKIGSEKELYELKLLGIYNGTFGDSLKYHKNMKFTTRDRDNDENEQNCANDGRGGWWYNNCAISTLDGKFFKEGHTRDNQKNGITWGSWHNYYYNYSLTFVEMMLRPV